jgi:hypothetical protein
MPSDRPPLHLEIPVPWTEKPISIKANNLVGIAMCVAITVTVTVWLFV